MELPGWSFLTVGVIVAVSSALIYGFVPKPDGTKNMAMALFFFIGMVFIIIGVIKTFFRKLENESIAATNAITRRVMMQQTQQAQKPTVQEQHINRVEEQMNRIYAEQNTAQQPKSHHPHTSNYAKAHPYQGVGQTQGAQHRTTQHAPQHTAHQQTTHQGIHQHYTIVACSKCGTKNYSTSNFCHGCGNRLR
jgi:FtsZ-interacting cell division protein ZipA